MLSTEQSKLDKGNNNIQATVNKISHKINRLWYRRDHKIRNLMHLYSKRIIDYCMHYDIHKIVIGYNKNWKHKIKLGRRGNKSFCQIPYSRLVKYIFDKGEAAGIEVCENEESYTSRCDALALEEFKDCKERCKSTAPKRRIQRGLYSSIKHKLINADVNGAINILRKNVNKMHNYLCDGLNNLIELGKQWFNPIKYNVKSLIERLSWEAHIMCATEKQGA